jgi:hypothetical protein
MKRYIQGVPEVKINSSGFNFKADSDLKSHIYMGPIGKDAEFMRF